MTSDHLIVNKKILPDYLEKVIEAREMLANHDAATVIEAVSRVGISRNTYYKYKDYVFRPNEQEYRKRAVISLVLLDEPGSLSAVLTSLSQLNASVITISQALPLAGKASVTISLDIGDLSDDVNGMMRKLNALPQTISVHLDAAE